MAEIIAASTTQTDSTDITVTAGTPVTFLLKGGAGTDTLPYGSGASVQAKSGAQYVTVGSLDNSNPMAVLTASGVFRVRKMASSSPVGVDQN